MISHKIVIVTFFVVALGLASMVMISPSGVRGQETIPTRTVKPDPTDDNGSGGGGDDGALPTLTPRPDPTDDNGGGGDDSGDVNNGGGGRENRPQPTSEPDPPDDSSPFQIVSPEIVSTGTPLAAATNAPISTATSTFPADTTNTPVPHTPTPSESIFQGTVIRFPADNEPFPVAEPCGQPPTFTADDAISVYDGPATDYPIMGLLSAAEVRPIIGRAAFTSWWVIQLDQSGRAGWVNHEQGIVHGLTSQVPIISAPDLNGIPPTSGGKPWMPPTTQADCAPPELLAGETVDVDDYGEANGRDDSTVAGAGNEQIATSSKESPPLAKPDSAVISAHGNETDALLNELAGSAPPLTLPGYDSQRLTELLAIVGSLLVIVGTIVLLFTTRARSSSEND